LRISFAEHAPPGQTDAALLVQEATVGHRRMQSSFFFTLQVSELASVATSVRSERVVRTSERAVMVNLQIEGRREADRKDGDGVRGSGYSIGERRAIARSENGPDAAPVDSRLLRRYPIASLPDRGPHRPQRRPRPVIGSREPATAVGARRRGLGLPGRLAEERR
jgi:hypothetical protein